MYVRELMCVEFGESIRSPGNMKRSSTFEEHSYKIYLCDDSIIRIYSKDGTSVIEAHALSARYWIPKNVPEEIKDVAPVKANHTQMPGRGLK